MATHLVYYQWSEDIRRQAECKMGLSIMGTTIQMKISVGTVTSLEVNTPCMDILTEALLQNTPNNCAADVFQFFWHVWSSGLPHLCRESLIPGSFPNNPKHFFVSCISYRFEVCLIKECSQIHPKLSALNNYNKTTHNISQPWLGTHCSSNTVHNISCGLSCPSHKAVNGWSANALFASNQAASTSHIHPC